MTGDYWGLEKKIIPVMLYKGGVIKKQERGEIVNSKLKGGPKGKDTNNKREKYVEQSKRLDISQVVRDVNKNSEGRNQRRNRRQQGCRI